jgi:hypothetical protein
MPLKQLNCKRSEPLIKFQENLRGQVNITILKRNCVCGYGKDINARTAGRMDRKLVHKSIFFAENK